MKILIDKKSDFVKNGVKASVSKFDFFYIEVI